MAQEVVYEQVHGTPRPSAGNMFRMTIIACSKTKLPRAARAVELYTGPVFTKSIEVARSEGLPILIFSTRYGLVDPSDVIEPYELSYEKMTPSERKRLISVVRDQSEPFVEAGLKHAAVLGGASYRFLIHEALRDTGVSVVEHPSWKQVYRQVYRK